MKDCSHICILGVLFLFMVQSSMAQQLYARIENHEYVPTLKYDPKTKSYKAFSHIASYDQILKQFQYKSFELAFPNIKSKWLSDVYYIEFYNYEDLDEFTKNISDKFSFAIPILEEIERGSLTAEPFYPNDSLYQCGNLSYLDFVRAPEAWNISKHYEKVKVGITDTYFFESHPDLAFDTIMGSNIYSNSDHGTAVSGVLGAKTNNVEGIASIGGLNSRLIASSRYGSDSEVLRLAMMGCKVINCSWFNSCQYSSIQDSLYYNILHDYDCLVVFGAGNGCDHCDSLTAPIYPASYESCLSVTSVGYKYERGDPARRNWKGVHCYHIDDPESAHHHNATVDLCAPGHEIQSTNFWHGYIYNDGSGGGTSFAAPLVAGTAAMVRAVNPNLTAVEVMGILKGTADSSIYSIPENAPYIGQLGTGKLDAYAAVRKACAIDIINEVYNTPGTVLLEGCIVTLRDSRLQNGASMEIDATVETEIISNFEIPIGCSLSIH